MPVLTAKVGLNHELFSEIISLYAKQGDSLLDLTYGKGNFWKSVELSKYTLTTNDIMMPADFHYDFTKTDFRDETFDLVVLDPPYAVTRSSSHTRGKCANFAYGLAEGNSGLKQTHEENVSLYRAGAAEARRILKRKGILVLKTQDDGKFWKHKILMEIEGFACEDLFILVNPRPPVWDPRWKIQHHGRKNHSFFIVHKKI